MCTVTQFSYVLCLLCNKLNKNPITKPGESFEHTVHDTQFLKIMPSYCAYLRGNQGTESVKPFNIGFDVCCLFNIKKL